MKNQQSPESGFFND